MYGSDYPLPGVIPLFSLPSLVKRGLLEESDANVLVNVRGHNALLLDFALKRRLRANGKAFGDGIFSTRDRFAVRGN